MSLSGPVMADLIITNLVGAGASPGSIDKNFIDALCTGIVSHIQSSAIVNPGVAVTTVVNVTTPAGPGSGTGIGTTTTPGTIS